MAAVWAGAVLGACAPAPAVLVSTEVYRNPAAQIASQTNVTAQRLAGDWHIRQGFAGQPAPSDGLSLSTLPDGALQVSVLGGTCDAQACATTETLVLLEPRGPGRWAPVGEQSVLPQAELWVLWMDFDDRTAAIGTPSGQFGWIMDKSVTGGGDRITAARDIMEWFGYNMAQLQEVRR